MLNRRHLLVLGGALLAGCSIKGSATKRSLGGKLGLYVPGYRTGNLEGIHIDRHNVPNGYDGTLTLLSRIKPDGQVVRALFAIQGHAVEVSADHQLGVFASMNGESLLTFDPESLAVIEQVSIASDQFIGGGHADLLLEQAVIANSERAPHKAFNRNHEHHYGRIALRDPKTLEVIERYSCHGIAPHDLAPIPKSSLLAVANYGSTLPPHAAAGAPNNQGKRVPPYIVEPSISIIDLADGRLVDKIAGPDPDLEIRHLTAARDALFAIQVRLGDKQAAKRSLNESVRIAAFENDRLAPPASAYLPAPMLSVAGPDRRAQSLWALDSQSMRQGLSILYDKTFDQVIATFPSSHRLIVVDRAKREISLSIDTSQLGLDYPCGLAFLGDGKRYVVSGSFENVAVLSRGSHKADAQETLMVKLFRHSHIAAA